jgi:hypothetical protein
MAEVISNTATATTPGGGATITNFNATYATGSAPNIHNFNCSWSLVGGTQASWIVEGRAQGTTAWLQCGSGSGYTNSCLINTIGTAAFANGTTYEFRVRIQTT